MSEIDRREFLRVGIAGLGSIAASQLLTHELDAMPQKGPSMIGYAAPPMEKVRIGFVGVGGMGSAHLSNLLKIKGVEVRAVCDIVEKRVERAQTMVEKAGFPKPEGYARSEEDFKRLCQRDDLDLVYTATPWEWHVPVCLAAMKNRKHAASEVPIAITIDQCWQLVRMSEKTRKHCIMMENCNYDKVEMMILNMVKKELFGELLYAECGYLHDLREVKHDLNGEGAWRRAHAMKRNGDFYPTHGLGPIAQCFDINRGNYFDYLVSFGTKIRGLHKFAMEKFGPDSPQAKEKFKLSDIVTTLLKTKRGETIVIKHDTNNPRPYSRDILVQGTGGIARKYPDPKVYIEGKSAKPHQWDPVDEWMKQYNHPVWIQMQEQSKGAGHGGMDFIEDYRLINALIKGDVPDMDVYDGVMMSAVTELSARSIALGSQPMKFPDFTGGKWKEKRELMVMKV
ncbi:MAG: Gfo/Idh/MocA family oxidoreductase [bacterium]